MKTKTMTKSLARNIGKTILALLAALLWVPVTAALWPVATLLWALAQVQALLDRQIDRAQPLLRALRLEENV